MPPNVVGTAIACSTYVTRHKLASPSYTVLLTRLTWLNILEGRICLNNYRQKLILLCVLLVGCVLTSIGVEYFGSSQKELVTVPTELLQKQDSFSKQKEIFQTEKSFANLEEGSNAEKFPANFGKSSLERKSFGKSEKSSDASKTLVNINTATLAELDTLPGVGLATAKKIIAYREDKHFESIEEIMEVKGIGKVKFAKMKERITVE